MILSTGPTGSGKSTSLYAILREVNQPDTNIITLEDPVEYRVERIRQVQLNTKAGMTFASGLRSVLRQDPDVIMVGEIRDRETAAIAVQAALTGHRLLSTIHTNDAAGAITRLIHTRESSLSSSPRCSSSPLRSAWCAPSAHFARSPTRRRKKPSSTLGSMIGRRQTSCGAGAVSTAKYRA